MRPLTARERKHLRGLGHALPPLVHIGKDGLTPAVTREVERALANHELIKVKFLAADRERKNAECAALVNQLDCALAGLVGHVALLYREHPNPEKRRIQLA